MDHMPIRLIATDIDGTLLNGSGRIPERNLRAIHSAQEKGITVAISSGRFPENVYILLEGYGLRCPIIGDNGGRLTDENLHVLTDHVMDTKAAQRVLEILLSFGSDYFIFGDRMICTSDDKIVHHSELSQGSRMRELGFTYFHGTADARQAVLQSVHKFFVCDNVPLEPVRLALQQVDGILLTRSGIHNIEIMPAGVDKGSGIRDMARLLGVPMEQVMALGDEGNDIPMLKAAGYGIAMGNASEEAKAAARYVTDTNENCGFAKAIERYALEMDSWKD